MKLISMIDYVLENDKKASNGGHYDKLVRYAKFLKQPLKLEMLVPCDEKGNVFSQVNPFRINTPDYFIYKEQYKEAKEKVLFKIDLGLRPKIRFIRLYKNRTIEDLIRFNVKLTDNALK